MFRVIVEVVSHKGGFVAINFQDLPFCTAVDGLSTGVERVFPHLFLCGDAVIIFIDCTVSKLQGEDLGYADSGDGFCGGIGFCKADGGGHHIADGDSI